MDLLEPWMLSRGWIYWRGVWVFRGIPKFSADILHMLAGVLPPGGVYSAVRAAEDQESGPVN